MDFPVLPAHVAQESNDGDDNNELMCKQSGELEEIIDI
jgi:hypothetical protein